MRAKAIMSRVSETLRPFLPSSRHTHAPQGYGPFNCDENSTHYAADPYDVESHILGIGTFALALVVRFGGRLDETAFDFVHPYVARASWVHSLKRAPLFLYHALDLDLSSEPSPPSMHVPFLLSC